MMKTFLKDNVVVWIWLALAIFIELFSICFTNCSPYLTAPFYYILILSLCVLALTLMKSKRLKVVFTSIFLVVQIALCIGFVILYNTNGTVFDFSMINQRSDAFGMLKGISINFLQITILLSIFVLYVVFSSIYLVKCKKNGTLKGDNKKAYKIGAGVLCAFMCVSMVVTPVVDGVMTSKQGYENKLYNDNYSKYQSLGITANAIYEMVSGLFASKVDISDIDTIANYLYGNSDESSYQTDKLLPTSQFNGISAGNNLIMIMVESFDWYVLKWYDAETIASIYPNICKFMGDSIVFDSYYTREKTDTSENNALLGSNPTGKYLNYDFAENEYPYALANMFKHEYPNVTANAYHQNRGEYYNREVSYRSLGFDDYYDIDDMEEFGVENTWDGHTWQFSEFTQDSKVMEHMVQQMFPTDEQFMTYWLTFSMHGFYGERETFSNFVYEDEVTNKNYENGYYGYFDELGVFPQGESEQDDWLRNYAAALKDFDIALGIMLDYLEANNLLENTTIVLYSDHCTYYNNLMSFGKHIDDVYNSELYRIPCMIYDQKLVDAYVDAYGDSCYKNLIGNDVDNSYKFVTVSKFVNTVDLIPTIFDLFGIKAWNNLYLGNSMFIEDVESIIYSRSYGIFVTDELICYSVNNLLYTCDGFTDADLDDFIARAENHLKKQEILDKIFYSDYFAEYEYIYP